MASKLLLFALLNAVTLSAAAEAVSAERGEQLRELVHQDCGSCHGMQLTGGLGPALTPGALTGKSAELLAATIREGRAGTPMPPWKTLLSETEIDWIVDYLQTSGAQP
ncbi:MAG: cytochrome c [Thiogranum sp.]|nr:cytochrome c [Thiogranum sp.]